MAVDGPLMFWINCLNLALVVISGRSILRKLSSWAYAGDMPILGPNCYGLLNYLDNITLWPDQHGGTQVESGVGIIAQSSNIAINLTMQKRGLDIAQLFTIGNQAVTLEKFARKSRQKNIPVVILKTGKTQKSRSAAISHTASLSGSDKVASAFIQRLD